MDYTDYVDYMDYTTDLEKVKEKKISFDRVIRVIL